MAASVLDICEQVLAAPLSATRCVILTEHLRYLLRFHYAVSGTDLGRKVVSGTKLDCAGTRRSQPTTSMPGAKGLAQVSLPFS